MVYYFTSTATDPSSTIYVGRDKFENEDLIAHAWDVDVWFHADKLSSAHVYLRMPDGWAWDDLPPDLLDDLAQLTKANSIEGNKKDNVAVIYTPAANLRKDGSMDVGQVSFHDQKKVGLIPVPAGLSRVVLLSGQCFRQSWWWRGGEGQLPELGRRTRLTRPGQEDIRRPEGEPHRQPPQQDKGRAQARPEAGEGRPRKGAPKKATVHPAGEGKLTPPLSSPLFTRPFLLPAVLEPKS